MKNKLKLTTTSKTSTKMLYDLIQTNAVLTNVILKQQNQIDRMSEDFKRLEELRSNDS